MMLKGKVALITGASRGIGKAIAELFIKEGAVVFNGDIAAKTPSLAKVSPDMYEGNLDVTNRAAVKEFVGNIIISHGKIDIVVNNSGICPPMKKFMEDVPEEDWNQVMRVNLIGMVACTNVVLPHMRAAKYGRIINLASIAGETGGVAASIAYSASKAAIICTTKVLAKKEGCNNITANCVAPGWIITEMTKTHNQDLALCPLGRRGEPIDVANAVLYLASEMGNYVTGTTMDVNGGVFMQ